MIPKATNIDDLPESLIEELMGKLSLSKISQTKEGFFKNSTFFDPVDKSIEREIKLFRDVLDRALVDFLLEVDLNTCSKDMLYIKADVEEWLDPENQEFVDACERAFLDSDMVYSCFIIIKQIIERKKESFTYE